MIKKIEINFYVQFKMAIERQNYRTDCSFNMIIFHLCFHGKSMTNIDFFILMKSQSLPFKENYA